MVGVGQVVALLLVCLVGLNAAAAEPDPSDATVDVEADAPPGAPEEWDAGDDPVGPSLFGQRGQFRLQSATTYPEGRAVFNTALEFFYLTDFLVAGDENARVATRISMSGVPIEGLELNGGFSLVMNENPAFAPTTTLTVGDPFLGVRYGRALMDWFALGLGLQVTLPAGTGVLDVAGDGTSLKILSHFDFRPLHDLLISLNVGFHLDNSAKIFDFDLNDAQRFSAGVNPYNQVLLALGLAYQIGPASPFLEYTADIAVGSDLGFGDNPHRLAIGARFWPLAHRTLNLLAAVEIGLGGVSPPPGAYRIPRYNVLLGVGWDFGAEPPLGPGGVRTIVKIKEVPVPGEGSGGRVNGTVVDARTGQPIPDARVVLGDKGGLILMTDREGGRFASCPAPGGPMKVQASAEGYLPNTQVVLVKSGEDVPVTVKLQPAEGRLMGVLKGTVRAVGGKPLAAKVVIPTRQQKVTADKQGKFKLELETGVFDVLISHRGHVTQRHKIKLRPGEEVILNVELFPRR